MAVSSLLSIIIFFFLFIIFVDGQCLDDQKKLLLELRSEFKFSSTLACGFGIWNETGDCCEWYSVECDDSGHVISLHLDWGISGRIGADIYYHNEVTLTVKGYEEKIVKIWPDFTCIDLSSNHFEGEIPDGIGNLTSLYLLNLSRNSLTDEIPRSLGALAELGSLDLSSNKLTGRIPDELAKLDFLSFLNVSYNHLTGPIPTGRQFQTFSADSFEGNAGLSGFPLNGSFNNRGPPGPSPSEDSKSKDDEIEWEYVFVASGYVVGIGSVAWTLLCCRRLRERYFEKIEEVADKIFYEIGRRKRHERRVRIREERNAVRRRHHQ
ncbi:receptor-like protein 35 isoform X3 [Salvia hispanica]|uniref:receptor-like protein 35 isoform X3 n=1 Tax=Salvia hispanica TaxID=49212 RepID=UPI0020090841|nr:receptor-like protein 35 isoform X3 [Salvia hispanica]